MLPSLPVVPISKKECQKPIETENTKGICEPISEAQNNHAGSMKTCNKSSVSPDACQPTVQMIEKAEEQHPDKRLQPIAPKPVNVVCMPDILCMRDVELEITEKQDPVLKTSDERVVKTGNAGPSSKCEKDTEEETPVFKKTITTGRSPPKTVKKKPKQIRDLEKTLNCLLSDNEQVKDEKAFAFAQSYFLKVTETLHGKDDATYHEFMKTMNEFGVTIFDAAELYKKVAQIFEKYPSLSEEFLAFLLPEQAMQCGKFMEYLMITKMRSFCRKLELYYSKQPSQLRKIYSSLSTLASNNTATLDDLRNTILPLLRNNSLLVNMFLELMPTEAPHASSLTDYESMDFSSVDVQNPKPEDWFETVEVPPPVEDGMYGGEDCICPCHIPPEGKTRRRSVHCMSCGTKFIQGRVYIHSGSMLRPARVSFKEMRTKAIERLSVKNLKTRRKIDKNQPPPSGNKKNSSTKGEVSSSNTSGSNSKMPPAKTAKKASKGKPLIENQKKPNKPPSPSKTNHNKKLSNDKKIAKPSRKNIKILSNNSENDISSSSSSSSSVKSQLVASKKVISQGGKVSCKLDKTVNKIVPQPIVEHMETTRRTGRSAARNLTFASDCGQKQNRRNTASAMKGDNANSLATDMFSKKSEVELSTNKGTASIHVSMASEKEKNEEKLLTNGSEGHFSCAKLEETSTVEHLCKTVFEINSMNLKNETVVTKDTTHCSDDQIEKPSSPSVEVCDNRKTAISNPLHSKDITSQHSSIENCSSDIIEQKGDKEVKNKRMELGRNIEESSSEDDTRVSNSRDLDSRSKCVLHCAYTSSDDKSDDSSSDQFLEESDQGSIRVNNDVANASQSEEEDITKEMMEFENNFENVSSEDEKNVLDSDFPINSSSESEIDDNFQMDVEDDICEGNEDLSVSSQNDNTDKINSENGHVEKPASTPWTRDEDKIILRTFQSVTNSEFVFQKICNELPCRTADEVQLRFQTLMSFLQKMAGEQTP